MDNVELREMITDYMEKGFLENIIDMFKQNGELYSMIGDLMRDERIRVRLGVAALLEELQDDKDGNIKKAIPGLIRNLSDDNPTIRGDAAYLIGIIGDQESIPYLVPLLDDINSDIREIAKDSITEIRRRS